MTSFSPREIVSELDRYIVGQKDAKRAVAIALRNRWRRQQLPEDLKEEVLPKNILMIGPTGCGKTEISRRLARLAGAPFLKVEATKFTEVGYVGRDVDSIVRDLVEVGIGLVRETKRREVKAQAEKNAEERVLDALVGAGASPATRESFRKRLRNNELNDKEIEIQVADSGPQLPTFDIPGRPGRHDQPQRHAGQGVRPAHQAAQASPSARPTTSWSRRRATSCSTRTRCVQEAIAQRGERRHRVPRRDRQDLRALGGRARRRRRVARGRAARPAAADRGHHGVDQVRAGEDRPRAVHRLGRLPRRPSRPTCCPSCRAGCRSASSCKPLTTEDLRRILTEPEASLIKQYVALMATEGVTLDFTDDAIDALADIAAQVNSTVENIGARRLQTVMERVLDEISFEAADKGGETITDRCGLRARPHRRPRQERRPEQVHPVVSSGACAPAKVGVAGIHLTTRRGRAGMAGYRAQGPV